MISRIISFSQKDENFDDCKFSDGNCSVQEKYFFMGSNVYSRFEVVAMEWLIQEILNFQCFLPTIHNFLWYILLPLIVFLVVLSFALSNSSFCPTTILAKKY